MKNEFVLSLNRKGTCLLAEMLALLKKEGYDKASLAVQKENYAGEMYKKASLRL